MEPVPLQKLSLLAKMDVVPVTEARKVKKCHDRAVNDTNLFLLTTDDMTVKYDRVTETRIINTFARNDLSLLEDNVAVIDPKIELLRSRKGHLMNMNKVAVVENFDEREIEDDTVS